MVFRKPYAFLIKHFRLIHLIITAILVYIALKSSQLYKYITDVITGVASRYDAVNYIRYGIYFYILVVGILCAFIYWLLKYKNKPRKIYIFTIVGYVLVGIFMFVLFSYMSGFAINSVNQKTIRLYRDVLSITLLFQYYIIIVMAIRGLGFDIKKFDFKRDAQELNLSEEDSEEVEVNVGVDTTNVMRGIRKRKREFGYFFREYKWYIMTILLVLGIVLFNKGYDYFNKKYKVYSENQLIGSMYRITVKNSYYSTDQLNNYVIINFDAYKNGKRDQLNVGNMTLMIGKEKYSPDKNICYKFNTLGNCYKKQYISSKTNNYILTYTVDKLDIQKAYLVYNEGYENTYKVKLVMKEY